MYYTNDKPWDRNKHKYDWRKVPLAKIATDRLGIVYKENKPLLSPIYTTVAAGGKKKSIVIATQSTAQAKYWNNPTGWQDLVDYYNNTGYKVLHSSKERYRFKRYRTTTRRPSRYSYSNKQFRNVYWDILWLILVCLGT